MIKIDFEFDTPHGDFRDALHLPEEHTFTEADIQAMKEVGDRIDGKPAQQTIISGDEDAPLVTKIVREVEASQPEKTGGGGGPK